MSEYSDIYPEFLSESITNTYVDNIHPRGDDPRRLLQFTQEATGITDCGGFHLHKRNRNLPEAEETNPTSRTFTAADVSMARNLGITWDDHRDELRIVLRDQTEKEVGRTLLKRKILVVINRIYDLLGLASPVTFIGKLLYSEVCLTE